MAAINRFSKSERLYNYKLKKLLFRSGKSFKVYPFRIHWHIISKENFLYKRSPEIKASIPWDERSYAYKKTQYDLAGNALPRSAVFFYPAKIIFSVPGKRIKKATDRNYIKRLVKEAYRKNKTFFYSFLRKKRLNVLATFSYIGSEKPDANQIEQKLLLSLQYLIEEIVSETKSKRDIYHK